MSWLASWWERKKEQAAKDAARRKEERERERQRRIEDDKESATVGQLVANGWLTKFPTYYDGTTQKSFSGSHHWLTIPRKLKTFSVYPERVQTDWNTNEPVIVFAFFDGSVGKPLRSSQRWEHLIDIPASELTNWRQAISKELDSIAIEEQKRQERQTEMSERRQRLKEELQELEALRPTARSPDPR